MIICKDPFIAELHYSPNCNFLTLKSIKEAVCENARIVIFTDYQVAAVCIGQYHTLCKGMIYGFKIKKLHKTKP